MVNNTMLDLDLSADSGILKFGVEITSGQVTETGAHSGCCPVLEVFFLAFW